MAIRWWKCLMIMCSRFDTIPACDGQTDRQTDRQTSCYSICAMHNVARKKTTSYERLSLTGTAGFGLNESLTKLSTSFARHSHDNSEREIQAFSAVSYIYCLQPSVSDHLKSERKTSIATSVFFAPFQQCLSAWISRSFLCYSLAHELDSFYVGKLIVLSSLKNPLRQWCDTVGTIYSRMYTLHGLVCVIIGLPETVSNCTACVYRWLRATYKPTHANQR